LAESWLVLHLRGRVTVMKAERMRLDQWLVERGFFPSREKARLAIMAGEVEIRGRGRHLKAGTPVGEGDTVIVHRRPRFVSRGGEKLDGALDAFGLDVRGRKALDVGASTGGFTHCLLERGVEAVVALDVGRRQLHYSLRQDPRVIPLEGVNARYLDPSSLPFLPDLVVVDLSFISLRLVLPALVRVVEPLGDIIALVKPQFEAGREEVGKKGVVRDPEVHRRVLLGILEVAAGLGLVLRGLVPSPLLGAEGNREYFAWWKKVAVGELEQGSDFAGVVERAVESATEEEGSGQGEQSGAPPN